MAGITPDAATGATGPAVGAATPAPEGPGNEDEA
jgi:hypothetical protein